MVSESAFHTGPNAAWAYASAVLGDVAALGVENGDEASETCLREQCLEHRQTDRAGLLEERGLRLEHSAVRPQRVPEPSTRTPGTPRRRVPRGGTSVSLSRN